MNVRAPAAEAPPSRPVSIPDLPREALPAILELFPDAAVAVDARGTILEANQRAADLFGYVPDNLVGRPVETLVPLRLRATHRVHRKGFAQEPRTRPMGQGMELSALRRDGSEVPVEISLHPVEDPRGLLVICGVRDVSERRRAAEALRASEARWRTLWESAPNLILHTDIEGRIAYASAAARAFNPAIASGASLPDFVPADHRHPLLSLLRRVAERGTPSSGECPVRTGDGDWRVCKAYVGAVAAQGQAGLLVTLADVTGIRRSQEALRESESRYRLLAENASDIIVRLTPQGRILYVSPALQHVLGHAPEAYVGRSLFELLDADESGVVAAWLAALAETGEAPPMESRASRADGSLAMLESRSRAVRHPVTGELLEIVAVARDITPRHQAEEELRRREQQLADAQRSARLGAWEWDMERNEVRWSEELYRLYGRDPSGGPLTYQTVLSWVHPEDRAVFREKVARCAEDGGPFEFEHRVLLPGGGLRWLLGRGEGQRGEGGRVVRMAGTALDVTERKAAEAERSFLAAIVASSEDAIWSRDLDGIITSWNPAAQRLLGYPRDEIVGKAVETIVPEDRLGEVQNLVDRVRDGAPVTNFETVRLRKDGRPVQVDLSVSPVLGANGKLQAVAVIARDITPRKEAERAQRLAQQRLLEIERLEADARRREVERLKEHDAFRSRLIDTASHELKTPLTAVRLWVDLLLRGRERLAPPMGRALQGLDWSVAGLARLVDDMLEVGRLESGRLSLRPEPLALEAVVAAAAEPLREVASTEGLALEVEAPERSVEVVADAWRIQQVVHNLLSNALKFTPAGGQVEVQVRSVDHGALVRVRDSGLGLTEEQRARLFQPFTQVHATTKPAERGSGLGLFISKGIVEQHGGRIWAESDGPGKGSTFSFWLPEVPPAARGADDAGGVAREEGPP